MTEASSPAARVALPLHTRGAYPAVLGALLLALVAETTILHLVLHRWIPAVAWISTGLGVWTGLWLLADWRTARARPPLADAEGLELRVGRRWHVRIPWTRVDSVSREARDPDRVALTLWGTPDLWLHLDRPVEIRGPLGIRIRRRVLGVGVDDPDALRRLLDERAPGPATG